ncbi:MAG TPA: LamG domain-containing protein [Streptosporangiaceae bacterium]|nr:LamG domain-containing protein [Streptosporangiaceae bacterium]
MVSRPRSGGLPQGGSTLGTHVRWVAAAATVVMLAALLQVWSLALPTAGRAAAGSPVEVTAAAALKGARLSGKPVEVAAWRGESREVYAESNGSFTATEHLRSVRTRKNGRWVKIDTSLRVQADNSVAPAASSVDLAFSGGGTAPMARMARAGRQLALTWPGSLPAPVVDGDTAVYADVLPGVDLRLRAEADGMSQLLVVNTAEAARNPKLAKLAFSLHGSGLRVEPDSGGGLVAVDAQSGGAVFAAPAPRMWDSSRPAEPPAGSSPSAARTQDGVAEDPADGPAEGAKVAPVKADVAVGSLTLRPDHKLLTGADTAFPVYIDPAWRTEKDTSGGAWAMVSSGWPSQSYYKFAGNSTEGMGFCDVSLDGRCVKDQKKRLFYRMPTSFFAGKSILSATFTAYETDAYDCNNSTTVQLWRTKGFITSSTWDSTSDNWLEHLDSRDVAYCSSTPVEFNAKAAVADAAAGRWSTTTFGLRAYSESSMGWWKRFADDAYLRVNYNQPPPQVKMSQLSMTPGGACVDWAKPTVWANDLTKLMLYAKGVTDPDGDKVSVQFSVDWGTGGWTSPTIGPKASGKANVFSLAYKSSGGPDLPQNTQLLWQVRAYDGVAWSPWSWAGSATSCYFKYDATRPDGPAIASADGRYPRSDPANEADPWNDGVGRYGTFTLDSAATDVTTYWFGVNSSPSSANARATSGGAPVNVQVAPTTSGLFFITAQAFDAAGNGSVIEVYYFRVMAGTPAKARWALDEQIDSTQVVDSSGSFPAAVHGGVTLGVEGVDKTAMQLGGVDGYAATSGPLVDTSKGFAVSAWVRLPATKPDHAAIVATQAGAQRSGFELYYSSGLDRWVFNRYDADSTTATIVRAQSAIAPQGGEWAHLAGVYDAVKQTISLYVNGLLAQTTAYTKPWNATGPVQIGAGSYSAVPGSFFSGEVDDVRVFDRIVSGDEVTDLATAAPVLKARWKLNDSGTAIRAAKAYYKLDETAGATRAEDTMGAYPAGAHGGVTFGVGGRSGTAARLNGTTGYMSTTGPVLDTTKSFSVSAWARLSAVTNTSVVVGQEGSVGSAFALYYSPAYNRWIFNMQTPDSATPTLIRAQSNVSPALNTWTHLVGVYDADAKQIRLYVNGVAQQTVAQPNSWAATGPVTVGRFKYKGGFAAMHYFSGDLDEVRVFDQSINDSEVARLAGVAGGGVPTADDGPLGNHLTLAGNANIDQSAGILGAPPGALVLSGAGDYAASTGPVVHTNQSFTVAGWVTSAGRPSGNAAIFSQAGGVNSGFTLRYSPTAVGGAGGYELEMPTTDTTGATMQKADHVSFQSSFEWDHVAVVYDAFADEMRLYVNGQLDQVEDGSRESYRSNSIGFDATDPLQLGRTKTGGTWGEYWPGVLDDVWAYSGVLTDDQIQELVASPNELPTDGFP